MQSPTGPHIVIDGKRYLYFGGTAYTALQSDARVIEAACQATRQYGLASATSRGGIGTMPPIREVEQLAARYFGCEDAFYFVSGYLGNTVFAYTLVGHVDIVFIDEAAHYCVVEAAHLLHKPAIRFKHTDPDDLARLLREHVQPGMKPMVLTDGVFAALGDIAPLGAYRDLLRPYPGSVLCVDDAHAVGSIGEHGRGTFEYLGLEGVNTWLPGMESAGPGPHLLMSATLSKALGGFGGIIAGSAAFIEKLKAGSHLYRGASAPSVPDASGTAKALELILTEPIHCQALRRNCMLVRERLRGLGLTVNDLPVPIISLTVGDASNMQRIHRELAARSIWLPYFTAYAGVAGEGLLRIAVFSTHTEAMIDELIGALREVI